MSQDAPQPDPTLRPTLGVSDALTQTVYKRLREVAGAIAGDGRVEQPTAIVHEAFLRLAESEREAFNDRDHFLRVAARSMRHALTDRARAINAGKRGGGWRRITLSAVADTHPPADVDIVALSEALEKLAKRSERQARLIELRFFAGLTVEQAATATGVSERTARNDWRIARAWLRSELDRANG